MQHHDDAIGKILDRLSIKMTGKPRTRDECPTCGEKITEFKDELSRREHEISGMCQKCQDETFG